MWFFIGLLLIILAAFLLVLEVFIPSFGLLTVFSIASLVGGLWVFFNESTAIGWIGVGVSVVVMPIVWIITYRVFPKTQFGKSIWLEGPQRPKGDAIPDTPELSEMIGRTGVVITPLRPVGMCDFDGERLECVAETGFIEKEKTVQIIRVEGTQLTVRIGDNY